MLAGPFREQAEGSGLGKSLGERIRGFKSALKDDESHKS
jgi:hypothetical protein